MCAESNTFYLCFRTAIYFSSFCVYLASTIIEESNVPQPLWVRC